MICYSHHSHMDTHKYVHADVSSEYSSNNDLLHHSTWILPNMYVLMCPQRSPQTELFVTQITKCGCVIRFTSMFGFVSIQITPQTE
jgi:hypothetical protein